MRYKIGDKVSVKKRFTSADVRTFAELSGDSNPIHLDEKFASETVFGKCVVHGLLTISIFSQIFGTRYPGTGGIYMMQNCKFLKPLFVDDEVTGEIELVEFDGLKNIGLFNTNCYDSSGNIIITGQAKIKLPA